MIAHGNGPMLAGSVSLEVVIHGRGGHASTPHLAVDPVVIAASAVLRLHTVVSRECSPAEQVVLSVSSLHAGTSDNVLPDRATLGLTVRGFTDEILDRVTAAVHRIVKAECLASAGAGEPEIRITRRSAPTVSDPSATATARRAHEDAFGKHRVTTWPGSMSTEDFPLFAGPERGTTSDVPTVYWMLGCVGKRRWAAASQGSAADRLTTIAPNHSPEFAPDVVQSLPTGIAALVIAALAHLAQPAASSQERTISPLGVGE
jgi:hippurate hydrolase